MHIKTEQTEVFFDSSAGDYDAQEAHGGRARELYPLIIERALAAGFSDLLDIACGTGAMLSAVAEVAPDANLAGVDLSAGMLEIAANRLGERALLMKADATTLPYDDASFDVITCNHAFHHFPAPTAALREWHRVLRPGGTVIIGENRRPFLKRLYWNIMFKTRDTRGDVKFYSQGELMRLLGNAGFERIDYTEIENLNCIAQAWRADDPAKSHGRPA